MFQRRKIGSPDARTPLAPSCFYQVATLFSHSAVKVGWLVLSESHKGGYGLVGSSAIHAHAYTVANADTCTQTLILTL